MIASEVNLGRALENQVIDEVQSAIENMPEPCRIDGVREVMGYLLGTSCMGEHVELSVAFANALVRMMITFVKELMLDRVRIVTDMKMTDMSALSERGDGCSRKGPEIENVTQLEECDSFLRSLRALQGDMHRLDEINAGVIESDLVISRSSSVAGVLHVEGSSVDHVVERSLLTGNACSGVHWLSARFGDRISDTVGSVSRLIAYLFFNSASIDSFFVGIHILRQSGQHVERVLTAIYKNTSVKAVRDRIAGHLSHRGFVPSAKLMALEQIYMNNCYWTELNRRWTEATLRNMSSFSSIPHSTLPPIQVECGNIPDIPVQLEGHGAGQIGSVSAEESQSVIKCQGCLEEQRATPDTACKSAATSRGYLHISVSWIDKMTEREFELVLAEEGQGKRLLELAVLHKDWRHVMSASNVVSVLEKNGKSHGKFIDRVIACLVLAEQSLESHTLSRHQLASIEMLLSLDAAEQSYRPPSFHREMLSWLVNKRNLPQYALLYLRRFSLGASQEAVEDLLEGMSEKNPGLKQMCLTRLGSSVLAKILQEEAARFDPLSAIAMWMMSGTRPLPSVCLAIQREYPVFEQLLVQEDSGGEEVQERKIDIFDTTTLKGDVSVRELLQDVFPDLDFSVLNPQQRHREVSDTNIAEYLLSQGRPCLAAQRMGSLCSEAKQRAARRVAFYNLFDDGIVASAVSFLDLFGEPTETLRVDVQSARTIISSVEGATESVRDLFLNFHSPNQLLAGLKLLEESAWAKEPPLTEAAAPSSSPPAGGTFESPWHLVALFCRVHSLPRSLTLLHELARNGDWVMFLHESDIQQCPIETVRDVVQSYFENSPLRSHLNILLEVSGRELSKLECENFFDSSCLSYSSEDPGDPSLLFIKYFHLFRFGQAKRFFSLIKSPETALAAVDSLLKDITVSRSSMLARELDLIVSQQDEDQERTTSPRSQQTLHDDESEEEMPSSRTLKDTNIDEIRTTVNRKEWQRKKNLVDTHDSVCALAHVLVDEFEETDIWNLADYDGLVSIVSFSRLEELGDLLLTRSSSLTVQRHHIDLLIHTLFSAAFVCPSKFRTFLNSVGEKRILDPASHPHERSEKLTQIAIADKLMAQTISGSRDSLLTLGATVKLSQRYHSIGLIGKHLRANQLAETIARDIRTTYNLG